MGLGNSRMRWSPSPRAGHQIRRRRSVRRTISSLLICGASSSRAPNEMDDYPPDLLVNSAERGSKEKFKSSSKDSDLEARPSTVEPRDKGKYLSGVGALGGNEMASSSYVDQPSPDCILTNERACLDAVNGINSSSNHDSSQIIETLSNSIGAPSLSLNEFSLDQVSVENNVDFSSSDFGSSVVSNSPVVEFHSPREGILSDESVSSNMLSSNSGEIISREARRNSRRLFWDAFSRRNSRRVAGSRTFVFSPDQSDHLRSHERLLLDFNGDDFRSSESRTPGSSDHQPHSRSEIWERLHGNLDSSDHANPNLSAEESGARAGISRIVMLAEALFEVLDQIHSQPMSLSLSVVSLPAPESVVESFPVKNFKNTERLKCGDDVSQCYICLSEYEEGDTIRVLPCHHEYHMSCVDKWLKEIHGVCPLCRGDVREGFTVGSVLN